MPKTPNLKHPCTCTICGTGFESSQAKANACSDECRAERTRRNTRDWQARKKAERADLPPALPWASEAVCAALKEALAHHAVLKAGRFALVRTADGKNARFAPRLLEHGGGSFIGGTPVDIPQSEIIVFATRKPSGVWAQRPNPGREGGSYV